MHIIFNTVRYWQIFLLKILQYFNFKVFYINIYAQSDIEKNKIAINLKKNNIFPLPLEFEKKISASYSEFTADSDEFSYKKNKKIVPDYFLEKYCNLFSIDEKNTKKLRLLIQDFVHARQSSVSNSLGMWSGIYPQKKIIYISFDFKCFYISDSSRNISKIIIPLNFLKFFLFFLNFMKKRKEKKNEQNNNISKPNFKELEKKKIAFILHKGLTYGSLFEKSLYYSDDKNSHLNKYNILHLDYENFLSPEENLHWVCLKKMKFSNYKILLKMIFASIKTFHLIRSWSTFLGWILCIQKYKEYLKYCEIIKKFKKLKIAIIDYDYLCPKTLILALEKNNIKCVATQERFIGPFYKSYCNVILDTYYAASANIVNIIKESKYNDIKNIIPVGQYRGDYISFYKQQTVPKEISEAKKNGKKILIVFGYNSPKNWFESNITAGANWSAQINFLEDIIKLSRNLKNTFIVLRYKTLEWIENKYFNKIFDQIKREENVILSDNYNEFSYAYRLCANADLVIAKHTSIADECLSKGIPVLFHEYTHNMRELKLNIPNNYLPAELLCHNFDDLFNKSKSILFSNTSKLMYTVQELNKNIYYVNQKKNVKEIIIDDIESRLILES